MYSNYCASHKWSSFRNHCLQNVKDFGIANYDGPGQANPHRVLWSFKILKVGLAHFPLRNNNINVAKNFLFSTQTNCYECIRIKLKTVIRFQRVVISVFLYFFKFIFIRILFNDLTIINWTLTIFFDPKRTFINRIYKNSIYRNL